MDPFIVGGLMSGIGSLGASLVNTFTGQHQSKELMDYQYKLQQEAIDRANAYNHPAEQMKRLAEAQLSPNLVYGSGVDGNQASAANPSIANRNPRIDNPLQDMGQNLVAREQLNLEKQKAFFDYQESASRRRKMDAETLGQLKENAFWDATFDTKVHQAEQKLLNDITKQGVMEQQSNNLRIQAANLTQQTNLLVEKTNLTHEQAMTEVVKRRALEAGIRLTNAQARQVGHMIDYIDAGKDLRELGYDIQESQWQADKPTQDWKKEHPTATTVLDLTKQVLGIGKDAAGMAAPFLRP